RYEEFQLQNPLLKSAIVSKAFQSVYGRYVRNLTDDFEVVFEKLIYAMKEVRPEEIEVEEF
ncbi:MAG: chromosome partitioning protein ParB, partial [Aquificota bacterium]